MPWMRRAEEIIKIGPAGSLAALISGNAEMSLKSVECSLRRLIWSVSLTLAMLTLGCGKGNGKGVTANEDQASDETVDTDDEAPARSKARKGSGKKKPPAGKKI